MKTQTLVKAVNLTLSSRSAERREWSDSATLTHHIAGMDTGKVAAAHADLCLSRQRSQAARDSLAKLPKDCRLRAARIVADAEQIGLTAARLGGDYSGSTRHLVTWGNRPDACTSTDRGDRYSRSCKYSKTDADHTVTLTAAGAVGMHLHPEVVAASVRDGLHVIALGDPDKAGAIPATWVRTSGKQIVAETGWIARCGSTIYHSTESAAKALAGAERKHRLAKANDRELVNSRLATASRVSMADVRRATGWCAPGCRQWADRWLNGNTSPDRVTLADALFRAAAEGCQYAPQLARLTGITPAPIVQTIAA